MVSENPPAPRQGPIIVPSAVSLQPGQSMPFNMENTPFDAPQSPSLPPKFEHFDAALVFAEGDYELAMEIQKKMNSCNLEENMFPKVCLYDNPRFSASKMCRAENVVNMCTLIFVVLTENTHDDVDVLALREGAFGLTRLAPKDELDLEKRYCVRPLHTKSKEDRKGVYKTPSDLRTVDSIDWYYYEKPWFQTKLKELFEYFIPHRLKREKQDNAKNRFQTAHGNNSAQNIYPSGNIPSHLGDLPKAARSQGACSPVQNSSQHRDSLDSTKDDLEPHLYKEGIQTNSTRGQGERITDSEDEDPYESLMGAVRNRKHPRAPNSLHSLTVLSAASSETSLDDLSKPGRGQEAGDSQSGSESLGDASGLTRDEPHNSFPTERTASGSRQAQAGLSDLGAHGDSGLGERGDNSNNSQQDASPTDHCPILLLRQATGLSELSKDIVTKLGISDCSSDDSKKE